jgi:hypothetical protein
VTVVAVDGSQEAVAAIRAGKMLATAAQFPKEIGRVAAETIYEHLAGKPVPKEIKIPVKLITKQDDGSPKSDPGTPVGQAVQPDTANPSGVQPDLRVEIRGDSPECGLQSIRRVRRSTRDSRHGCPRAWDRRWASAIQTDRDVPAGSSLA